MHVCHGGPGRKLHPAIVHSQEWNRCPLCEALERAARAEDALKEREEETRFLEPDPNAILCRDRL